MVTIVVALILVILLLMAGMMANYYSLTPLAELKRRASKGDTKAALSFAVARHTTAASSFLLVLAGSLFAIYAVLVSREFTFLGALGLVVLVMVIWLMLRARAKLIEPIALWFAPWYSKFLVAVRPYMQLMGKIVGRVAGSSERAELYEKDDLLELIEKQKKVSQSRIDNAELDLALHSLTFGEKLVKDHLTPRSVVRFVRSDEPVSTVLMSELHDSGFSRFPVYMDELDNIVGTLYLKDLVERRMSGKVFSAMSTDYYFADENDTLMAVLEKFLKTKHHLFVVKNQFGEVVGVITIEDVIEQMMGRKIVDEFDEHDDMRTYAADAAKEP